MNIIHFRADENDTSSIVDALFTRIRTEERAFFDDTECGPCFVNWEGERIPGTVDPPEDENSR